MDLKETGWDRVDRTHLTQDWDKWHDLVNAVMNLRVSQNAGDFQEGCMMQLVCL
jgi:hypothetical protein